MKAKFGRAGFVFLILLAISQFLWWKEDNVPEINESHIEPLKLIAFTTVSYEDNDGLQRMLRSAEEFGITVQVTGLNEWVLPANATPLEKFHSKVQKIGIYRKAVALHRNEENAIILLVDGYDLIFQEGKDGIFQKFLEFDANIVFGAERNCFPYTELAPEYPEVESLYPFLNSGFIIGYAQSLHELLQYEPASDTDDQGHFSRLYVERDIREGFKIKLDHYAKLVQNLFASEDHIELQLKRNESILYNIAYQSAPSIVHANGGVDVKFSLQKFGNYIGNAWTLSQGCIACKEGRIDLTKMKDSDYPLVVLGVFVERYAPFLEEMLHRVSSLLYPKKRIFLYVFNNVPFYEDVVGNWTQRHRSEYLGSEFTSSSEKVPVAKAKHIALDICSNISCDVFFNIESDAYLENPNTLNLLISYNRSFVAPLLKAKTTLRSNFLGEFTQKEVHRFMDYDLIVKGKRRGIWAVSYVYYCYVIWRSVLINPRSAPNYLTYDGKPENKDAVFNINFFDSGKFKFISNLHDFGHLLDIEDYNQICRFTEFCHERINPFAWEQRYLHEDYQKVLKEEPPLSEVCPQVYVFPVFSKRFSIDLMADLNQIFISNSSTNLTYEPITKKEFVDVTDIGLDESWLNMFQKYVLPTVPNKTANNNDEIRLGIVSVIKNNSPAFNEQTIANNSAYFTIRVQLSTPGSDYIGREIAFMDHNCAVPAVDPGWVVLYTRNASRLQQEPFITNGTKFELVSSLAKT